VNLWSEHQFSGAFPEGYTPEDFIKGKERSILRNPLIAETLYKSKEIEKWGSGLKRIHEECRLNDVKVDFEILKSGFMVVFHRDLTMSENESVPGDGGINQLFLHIRNNPGKRTVDIAKSLNISLRTTER
jgi:ATP-dependent DNA helicase RecG